MNKLIGAVCACLLISAAQAQQPAERRSRQETRREQTVEQTHSGKEEGAGRAARRAARNGAQELQAPEQIRHFDGAHLRLEHAAYDFGDVGRKDGDLVRDFGIVNDGSAPLVVTRVITSCSCLKASFPKRPVPPGGRALIRITYEPHKSEPGTFHKVIQIYSNSVDGRCIITVQGNSIDPNKM